MDYNFIPLGLEYGGYLNDSGITFGTFVIKDQNQLGPLGVAKLENILGDQTLQVYFGVYFPVKFEQLKCTKKIEEAELPIFYTEAISASLPAEPKSGRSEKK